MTDFEGCYLTAAGLALSAKSGVNIIFTRVETGSGLYTSPDEVRALTALKHKEYEYQLEDVQIEGEVAKVVFYVTNMGVTDPYALTEIGIYARNADGEEILYCVAFALEDKAETINPQVAGQITYCQKFCVDTKVSTSANVTVQIDGTDHEWAANYFKKYAGEVDLENGTLQEQIANHTHDAMVGATADTVGKSGMVPTPQAGQQHMVLCGDGNYKKIEDEIGTSFTEASALGKLQSGEGFKKILGKLAKAVSTIFTKLDKSSVVNNNTTTQSGFALDARQANPNISGTMANNLMQLNNDSKNIKAYYGALIAGDNVVFRDSGYIYNSVYIANSIVILSFSLIVLAPLSTKQVIVSLPDFLKGKIEMNNFSAQTINGESLFLFSDNSDYIWVYFNDSQNSQKLKIGDEIRVFGIGCLRSVIVSA